MNAAPPVAILDHCSVGIKYTEKTKQRKQAGIWSSATRKFGPSILRTAPKTLPSK